MVVLGLTICMVSFQSLLEPNSLATFPVIHHAGPRLHQQTAVSPTYSSGFELSNRLRRRNAGPVKHAAPPLAMPLHTACRPLVG